MSTSYTFTSGNRVSVSYDLVNGLQMSWDRWPPRQVDVVEWRVVRHKLIEKLLPPGTRFAIVDEDALMLGCKDCDDD